MGNASCKDTQEPVNTKRRTPIPMPHYQSISVTQPKTDKVEEVVITVPASQDRARHEVEKQHAIEIPADELTQEQETTATEKKVEVKTTTGPTVTETPLFDAITQDLQLTIEKEVRLMAEIITPNGQEKNVEESPMVTPNVAETAQDASKTIEVVAQVLTTPEVKKEGEAYRNDSQEVAAFVVVASSNDEKKPSEQVSVTVTTTTVEEQEVTLPINAEEGAIFTVKQGDDEKTIEQEVEAPKNTNVTIETTEVVAPEASKDQVILVEELAKAAEAVAGVTKEELSSETKIDFESTDKASENKDEVSTTNTTAITEDDKEDQTNEGTSSINEGTKKGNKKKNNKKGNK